ncbi:hypothetical protein TNCV_4597691 [Trichonephila clavipes]|nr:hypothetical protein TNCV_4597691 [Trichonephila clavipes]
MRFANSILSKTKGWPFKLPSHILIAKEPMPKLEESKHPSHVNGSREPTHAIAMNHGKSKGISISRKSCLETCRHFLRAFEGDVFDAGRVKILRTCVGEPGISVNPTYYLPSYRSEKAIPFKTVPIS